MQDEMAECGYASLVMCLQTHGDLITLAELRENYPIGISGSNFLQLGDIAEIRGFQCDSYELSLDEIPDLQTPCILHWDIDHFVVLTKVTKNKIVIHDPAVGEIIYNKEEVNKHFTGYALELTPTAAVNKTAKPNKRMSVFDFMQGSNLKKHLLYTVFMALVLQLMALCIPLIMQTTIDELISIKETGYILGLTIVGIAIIVVTLFLSLLKSWTLLFIGYRWHAHFSSYYFKKITNLSTSYIEQRGSSDIYSRFRSLDHIKDALSEQLVAGIIDSIMIIVTFFALIMYNLNLALVTLGFFLIYSMVRYNIYHKEQSHTRKEILANAKEDQYFLETVRNIESVKIFNAQRQRQQGWKKWYTQGVNENIELAKVKMWILSGQQFLNQFELLTLLFLASVTVINGQLTLGGLFAFFTLRQLFSEQGKKFIDTLIHFKVLSVHLDRLDDIEKEPPEQQCTTPFDADFSPKGTIELRNISFKHKGADHYLFKNYNLTIQAGENVAITGESGTGKTTLMKIMMGLLPIESGQILLDNQDINTIGINNYRHHIAAVLQGETLMTGSILQNIVFTNQQCQMEKLRSVCEQACVLEDITRMNMQFNTLVSEGAAHLSGGQVQRLLLARALYKSPTLLFLDEATAFLDPIKEKKIIAHLKKYTFTRISIAHRQETVVQADREIKLTLPKT
jgi:ATP-binding cassette subfamily B protein RaxB